MKTPAGKYCPAPIVALPTRRWPDRVATDAPRWCSVDLRDGNQALPVPMTIEQKSAFFRTLVAIGFKEIEVGFPSASQIEFDFIRRLIDKDAVPDNVTIQVLVQAREHLIARTFEAIDGAKRATVHLYNSTSEAQRRIVFGKSRDQIVAVALQGVAWVKQYGAAFAGELSLEYSPESFTGTEPEYALEICNAVIDAWSPTAQRPVIINLPSTVETTTPNRYADRIEWMSDHLHARDRVILSVHTHNDRGTAVASAELAVLAGAQRVEGTILGNGERTGNLDILTMAMNMRRDGIDTGLDFSDSASVVAMVESCTQIATHPRHPYVGELVYTAFSGSHQDAINKGLAYRRDHGTTLWEVPYLPIDPADIGRTYDGIIRVNSQSGKGGVAYTLAQAGYTLPKWAHPIVARAVQRESERTGGIIDPERIVAIFREEFVDRDAPVILIEDERHHIHDGTRVTLHLRVAGKPRTLTADHPDGAVSAAVAALGDLAGGAMRIVHYDEHMRTAEGRTEAVAYLLLESGTASLFGAACAPDIVTASIRAAVCALNRRS